MKRSEANEVNRGTRDIYIFCAVAGAEDGTETGARADLTAVGFVEVDFFFMKQLVLMRLALRLVFLCVC